MLALLPFLFLLFITLVIQKKISPGWRVSFLLGSVFWGLTIALLTEVFSIFRIIGFWSVFFAWFLLIIANTVVLLLEKKPLDFNKVKCELKTLSLTESLLITCVILAILIIGITAWVYPPNTWDSMTYHMSRVMHWIQNHNIGFFPTSNFRELQQNPWVEYALLHLQILYNGDHLANFVQWFCLIGNIVGVTLIAQELKVSRIGQILAAVFCVTIPMAILQASSTQTDLAVSYWLVCFVFFSIKLIKKPDFLFAFATGIALGLGILTKATAYIFAFPFLCWLVISFFKDRVTPKWIFLSLIALLVLSINSGHYLRNYSLFGNPLGSQKEAGGHSYKNEVFSLPQLTSNVVRNISLHIPRTSNEYIDSLHDKAIIHIHELLRISPNDERTTWQGTSFDFIRLTKYEDNAANPWHFFFIFLFLLIYLITKNKISEMNIYILLIILCFVLFCGYLKWQPWHSRLHLPLFVLFSPFIGFMQSQIRNKKIVLLMALGFFVLSFPYLLQSKSRPLIGHNLSNIMNNRNEEYFHNRRGISSIYGLAVKELSKIQCSNIGLRIGYDDYEYPLWRLLEAEFTDPIFLSHVKVENITEISPNRSKPDDVCALFTIDDDPPNRIFINNNLFEKIWSNEKLHVYKRSD